MGKVEAVTNIEELRKQLDNNCLFGDSMLTLKWLMNEYDNLNKIYNKLEDDYDSLEVSVYSAYEEVGKLRNEFLTRPEDLLS